MKITAIIPQLFFLTIFSLFPLACTRETEVETPATDPNQLSTSTPEITPPPTLEPPLTPPETKDSPLTQDNPPTPTAEIQKIGSQPPLALSHSNNFVYFDFDSATLTPLAQRRLQQISLQLQDNQRPIIIAGHTDAIGSDDYNLDLGRRRAETVKNFLTALGVDSTHLSTVSYGETQPIRPASHPQAWAANRRVEFSLVPDSLARLKPISATATVSPSNINHLVYFNFDSATLTPLAKRRLQQISRQLKAHQHPITIAGHTDATGSDEYNLQLSRRRAATVKDFLATLGVNPALLSTVSYGETQTLAQPPSQNRRVEITIVPPTQALLSP